MAASWNWRLMRKEIVARCRQAMRAEEREKYLSLYMSFMDTVELGLQRQGAVQADIDEIKRLRGQEYRLLLIEECKLNQATNFSDKGVVDAAMLAAITTREVSAGRMDPSDDVHLLALSGAGVLKVDKP
jgi:hypothetical protein